VSFKLFIADANFIWEVDDCQIAEWADLLNKTAAGDKVLRSILQIDEPDATPRECVRFKPILRRLREAWVGLHRTP
jgi:hypothetical protein